MKKWTSFKIAAAISAITLSLDVFIFFMAARSELTVNADNLLSLLFPSSLFFIAFHFLLTIFMIDLFVGARPKEMEAKAIQDEKRKYATALADKTRIIERMNTEVTDAFNNVALLYTASQYLNSVLDVQELTRHVHKIFSENFKCDQFALYFVGSTANELVLSCVKGFPESSTDAQNSPIKFGEGITGKIAETGRAFYLENVNSFIASQRHVTELEKLTSGSVFGLPLMARGSLIGVLLVTRASTHAFTPTDRQSLQSLASQMAVAYDRCQLYTRTKDLAIRDELTGIYNRRHFKQMLELEFKRAHRYKRPIAVLMIDVDHFKKYNDCFGHIEGDKMLKKITTLLKKNLREVDVLARYGGEEFVVMLTDTTLADGVRVAEKLTNLVRTTLHVQAVPQLAAGPGSEAPPNKVTVSIGVSAAPECAQTLEELLNASDTALYMAKGKGRDRVYAYHSSFDKSDDESISKSGIIH